MSNVYCIWGPVYSRKSTIALSIPGRKYIFDLEFGVHRAKIEYPDEPAPTLWHPEVDLDVLTHFKGDRVIGKKERWLIFTQEYVKALQNPEVDVIILDTAKWVWTICHQSILQEKQDVQLATAMGKAGANANRDVVENDIEKYIPDGWRIQLLRVEFTPANERMEHVISISRSFGKDLVLINHEKEIQNSVFINGKIEQVPSGKFELDGFRHTEKLSDWVFSTAKEDEIIDVTKSLNTKVKFSATVTKCPIGSECVGQTLTNLTLPTAVSLAKIMQANSGNGAI